MASFARGDRVTWVSHGRHGSVRKTGVVVWVIPAGERPQSKDYRNLFRQGCARKEESYLVEVKAGPRTFIYHPRTRHLRRAR